MESKLYSDATGVPMGTIKNYKLEVEANDDIAQDYQYATAPEQTNFTPGSPNDR